VFLGLAVKFPVVPFHAWLPAAYAEAPTPVTMLLTGLLSKMGVYGMLRIFLPVFPEVLPALAPLLMAGGGDGSVRRGGGARANRPETHARLFVGEPPRLLRAGHRRGRRGAPTAPRCHRRFPAPCCKAFNHGIIASALFFGIAMLETRSRGQRGLERLRRLRAQTPVFCGLIGMAVFASLGLPGAQRVCR
jgi:NADH-quinone oxidoreductase subunit M